MTKQQKLRRIGFAADFNAGDDDFILADLDLIRDDEERPPVPLNNFMDDEEVIDSLLIGSGFNANNEPEDDRKPDVRVIDDFSDFDPFLVEPVERHGQNEKPPVSDNYAMADFDDIPDEDAIDRLLINAGFDANNELEPDDGKPDVRLIDELSPVDEFAGFDRVVIEPVGQAEQHQQTTAEEILVSNRYALADFNDMPVEEATESLLTDGYDELEVDDGKVAATSNAVFNSDKSNLAPAKKSASILMKQEAPPETVKQEPSPAETTAEIKPELAVDKLNNPVITESYPIGYEQEAIEKLINDCEVKVKKATVISYASLGFGLVALLAMVVMAVMVFSAQTKISKLSDLVTILEEDMGSIVGKNPDLVIDNSDSSVERLNGKVNGGSEEQVRSATGATKSKMTTDITKPAAVKKLPVQNLLTKQSQASADASKKK